MRKNKLPAHYKSAQETGRVRPAVDSGDGGVHVPPERISHLEARPAGNYLADDLSNSVQITLAKGVMTPGSDKASVSNLGLKLADGTKVAFSLSVFNGEAAQNDTPTRGATGSASAASAVAVGPRASKAGTWLLSSALISLITLFTISLRGTAVTDTAKAGAATVAGAASVQGLPTAPASLRDVDRSTAQHHDTSSGAHRTAADRDETGTRDLMNQGSNQGDTFTTEKPKAAEAKTLKSKKGFMVPPPPPTPCVLPPAFGFFVQQPAEPQQRLGSGGTEATQSAAQVVADEKRQVADEKRQAADQELQEADQELQAALRSSLRTMGEWTR